MTDVKEAAKGRWFGVLTELGVDSKCLERPNKKCPICRNSEDSFSFTDLEGNGTFFCRKGHSGGGFDLLIYCVLDGGCAKMKCPGNRVPALRDATHNRRCA